MTTKVCLSSNKEVVNDVGSVLFTCPQCQKGAIVRSKNARQIVARYKCPECGFTGPN